LEATITLQYKNETEAESVAKAVLPDNSKLPQGLIVETRVAGSRVLTIIQCETELETFIATIDDLFSCVSIAEYVISAAKGE
jgi:hypothetical protein